MLSPEGLPSGKGIPDHERQRNEIAVITKNDITSNLSANRQNSIVRAVTMFGAAHTP
jgi:hypothetical protein